MAAAFYLAATILAVPPMFKRGFQSQGLFGDKGEEVCYSTFVSLSFCLSLAVQSADPMPTRLHTHGDTHNPDPTTTVVLGEPFLYEREAVHDAVGDVRLVLTLVLNRTAACSLSLFL